MAQSLCFLCAGWNSECFPGEAWLIPMAGRLLVAHFTDGKTEAQRNRARVSGTASFYCPALFYEARCGTFQKGNQGDW